MPPRVTALNESSIVLSIAELEAGTLRHVPDWIHLFGAALYRIRDADRNLAQDLGVSVVEIRKWAVTKLPPKAGAEPFDGRYEDNVDFEYTFTSRVGFMKVSPVSRPVKLASKSPPEPMADHKVGIGVFRVVDSSPRDARQEMLVQFIRAIRAETDPSESSLATIRRILIALLPREQIQDCLRDFGISVEAFTARLGETQLE